MKKHEPPKSLSTEAAKWWKKLAKEYVLDDEAGLLLLQTAFEAFDRMRQAQKQINKEGLTIKDRFGQDKAHPLCTIERDSRSQMLQALKTLNLDIEPLRDGPGRPGGK
ncbi:MAG: hypothetical protein BMS9Abin36_0795 [Gammaproteobacteria bacterium]|nr:MAG: hypothetical protein BMS9Abin36_0795 [Gammaproteobacteria bacterium]